MTFTGEYYDPDLLQPPGFTRSSAPQITISLSIDNTYEDGDTVVTTVIDHTVPAPPEDDRSEWAQEHLYPLTGTGRTDGDSWYDVTVTACSDPTLVGTTFDFGY